MKSNVLSYLTVHVIGYATGIASTTMMLIKIIIPNALGFSTTILPDNTNGIEVVIASIGLGFLIMVAGNWFEGLRKK